MNIQTIPVGGTELSVLADDGAVLCTRRDLLDLIADTPSDALVLYAHNLEPDYFDLSTRKLGDLLQLVTNYRRRLAIVGDFAQYPSKPLKDLIRESNRRGEHLFVASLDEVIARWGK